MILDALTGGTQHVPGAGGGDEVWFTAGDGKYYATGSASALRPTAVTGASLTAQGSTPLAVIDSEDQNLIQLVPMSNVPAVTTGSHPHPAGTAHSVAVSAENDYMFVPLPANNAFPDCVTGCIAVFARPSKVE